MRIRKFEGEYRFLSNFYPSPIEFRGAVYASAEHAYQSAKSDDPAWKEFCADPEAQPSKVKKASAEVQLVADWDAIRIPVMRECLKLKFSQEPLKSRLLETGDTYLMEGNWWGDVFWGVDLKTNTGQNHLGQLLMEIREELRLSSEKTEAE